MKKPSRQGLDETHTGHRSIVGAKNPFALFSTEWKCLFPSQREQEPALHLSRYQKAPVGKGQDPATLHKLQLLGGRWRNRFNGEQPCANEQPNILCVLPSSFPSLCVNASWGAFTGSMLHCLLDKLVWDCKLFSWSRYFSWCLYWVFLSACFYILALKCNELTKSFNLATSYA